MDLGISCNSRTVFMLALPSNQSHMFLQLAARSGWFVFVFLFVVGFCFHTIRGRAQNKRALVVVAARGMQGPLATRNLSASAPVSCLGCWLDF